MNEDRYLYCETITGEWWYKDMKTGEDLPMYSTPIYRPTIEELNEECSSLYNKCKYLQSKIDKAIEYLVNNINLEMDDFTKMDLGCNVLKILDLDKYNEFLKENK